jgi:hypothetical protein
MTPTGLVVLVQVVLVEPARRLVRQAKMGQGGGDPVMLGPGEGHRVGRAAGHNRPFADALLSQQLPQPGMRLCSPFLHWLMSSIAA